jgi:hypothetical protein
MNKLTKILAIAVFFALLPALSAMVSAQPVINPADVGCKGLRPFMLAQSDYGGPFDLNYCQWECRMRFGLEPTGTGGGGGGMQSESEDGNKGNELQQSSPTYNQYAACIANCNRTFWQEFEKNTRGTGKTP